MIPSCLFRNAVFVIMPMKTLYSTGKDLNLLRRNLEMDFTILHQWFHQNHMLLNPGKCHYMIIGSRDLSHEIMLNNNKFTSSNEEKLLGIFLDSKLSFESHIGSLCRKAGQKINALARLKNCLTSDQRNLLLNSFMTEADLLCKSMDWFLYDNGLRHERVNSAVKSLLPSDMDV